MPIVRVTRNGKATTRQQVVEAIREITGETVLAVRLNPVDLTLWNVVSTELTRDINDGPATPSGFQVTVIR